MIIYKSRPNNGGVLPPAEKTKNQFHNPGLSRSVRVFIHPAQEKNSPRAGILPIGGETQPPPWVTKYLNDVTLSTYTFRQLSNYLYWQMNLNIEKLYENISSHRFYGHVFEGIRLFILD